MREINSHLIMVLQFVISVVTAFVFGYILLGATIFSTWENWSFLEGAYFSFITLTTIGFGDFVPGDAVLGDDDQIEVRPVISGGAA